MLSVGPPSAAVARSGYAERASGAGISDSAATSAWLAYAAARSERPSNAARLAKRSGSGAAPGGYAPRRESARDRAAWRPRMSDGIESRARIPMSGIPE